jgi:hypothetical protein
MRRYILVVAALLLAAPAAAQQGIRWGQDVQRGIKQAQAKNLPLMFWVVGRSGDRDHDTERDQKRAFADPLVLDLSTRFVTVKMSRSRHRDLLQQWDISPRLNLWIVFVKPSGERISDLSATGATHVESLAQKMSLVFRLYRTQLFQNEIKPKLDDEETPTSEVKRALTLIAEYTMLTADDSVIKLLERPNLPPELTTGAYNVLAALSTSKSVKKLLERAVIDKAAAVALTKCTPGAATQMLEAIGGPDADLHKIAYRAVAKVCKVRSAKPDRFWGGKNQRIKDKEIQRIKRIAEKRARDWKSRYEEYR